MMTNLFSVFDPSSSIDYSLNWVSMLMLSLFIPQLYWVLSSKYIMVWKLILMGVVNEIKISLINFNKLNVLLFMFLFVFIMLNNFVSLFPYIFSSTSHICITVSISLMIWVSMMIFGWVNFFNHMLVHLTPQGTPDVLMPFMVMIEFISNIIRPLTLSVRLSANIIAGHLLITLMSQSHEILGGVVFLLVLIQCILMVLEVAVSFIQSYVYSILSVLYSSETNYENIA
uniref:ATP synthase subunit a n=1 Tax=Leptopilina syphax TaxID=2755057 RepID=A0A7D6JUJ8_9HYME|nr:ATP synthase F0 subunit 6 [Leptopilina syphax]